MNDFVDVNKIVKAGVTSKPIGRKEAGKGHQQYIGTVSQKITAAILYIMSDGVKQVKIMKKISFC